MFEVMAARRGLRDCRIDTNSFVPNASPRRQTDLHRVQPDQWRAKHHGVTAATFLVEVSSEPLRRIAELIDVVN
jgi:hypothetical protein